MFATIEYFPNSSPDHWLAATALEIYRVRNYNKDKNDIKKIFLMLKYNVCITAFEGNVKYCQQMRIYGFGIFCIAYIFKKIS